MIHQDYVDHAEECERLAMLANLKVNRKALIAAAGMWRKVAADAAPRDGPLSRPIGDRQSRA